jgi:two-component sensor histidine kinase
VSCINQDNTGTYWVSTLGSGLFAFDENFKSTNFFAKAYDGNVLYVKEQNKQVFFNTSNNDLFQLKRNHVEKILNYASYFSHRESSLNSGYYLDDNYNFYNVSNLVTEEIENVTGRPPLRVKASYGVFGAYSAVRAVISDGSLLYVNARTKVMLVDPSASVNGGMRSQKYISDSTRYERIFGMAEDPEHKVWYSTVKEMFRIKDGKQEPQPQFGENVFKFFDFYGEYLIGCTHYNRLVICRNLTGKIEFDSIPQQNCIWDNLYRLDSNHVLVGTNNLYRMITLRPSSSGKCTIITLENPFIPVGVDFVSSDESNCYFFKDGSITSIPIDNFLERPNSPKLFYKFLITSKKVYEVGNEIEIPFGESKNIRISFTTLAFGGKDVNYQYSVSRGDGDTWGDIHGDELNLVNSGWGTYIVKVRARSMSSDYSTPIVFTLHISRPFWAGWWFITLAVLSGIAIVALLVRLRFIRMFIKKEKEHETQVRFMKSEYKALNALMNPHFIFNTLNNVQGLVNRNDKLAANEYLRIFADLVRQNMHNISKEMISLQKELDLVRNYLRLEKLRFKELLNYSIEVDQDVDLSEVMVPPLLLQPLVENSIKHGILPLESAQGVIRIHIYAAGGSLFIEVMDNGVGISRAQLNHKRHEPFGLENVEKRIEQLSIILNKKIEFYLREEKNAAGEHEWTKAIISMPLDEHDVV